MRHKRRNKHHMTPRSRRGERFYGDSDVNLLLIDIERHEKWHKLWGNRTIEEVLALLTRLARMKGRI